MVFLWHNVRSSQRGAGVSMVDTHIPDAVCMAMTTAMSRTMDIEDFYSGSAQHRRNFVAEPQGGYILSIFEVKERPERQGDPLTISVQYRYIDREGAEWVIRRFYLDRHSNMRLASTEFDLYLP